MLPCSEARRPLSSDQAFRNRAQRADAREDGQETEKKVSESRQSEVSWTTLGEDKKRHRVSGARSPVIRGSPRLKAESEIISGPSAGMGMEHGTGQRQPCAK